MKVHDLKKKMGSLNVIEKRAMRSGDKTILYEKLGLLEEKDIKLYQAKFGLKQEDMDDDEAFAQSLEDKSLIGKKKKMSRFAQFKESKQKEHFVTMKQEFDKQQKMKE